MVKIFYGQRELVAIGKRIAGTLFQPTDVFSSELFPQHRLEKIVHIVRDAVCALRRGMNAIVLQGSGDLVNMQQNKREERNAELFCCRGANVSLKAFA